MFATAGCARCHGADLAGTPAGPDISTIGSALITDLPTVPSGLDQMIADYEEDPRMFLENCDPRLRRRTTTTAWRPGCRRTRRAS